MIVLESPGSILGREATWVGYGFTGTGLTGQQLPIELRQYYRRDEIGFIPTMDL